KVVLQSLGLDRVDGVLFDLGGSMMQFADPGRGFSFAAAGPLDMRMDGRQPRRAADLVNELPERELAGMTWLYGEERWSLRLARGCTRSPGSSACTNGETRWLRVLTKKPITPTPAEIARNPRARSAKLRVAERMPDDSTE